MSSCSCACAHACVRVRCALSAGVCMDTRLHVRLHARTLPLPLPLLLYRCRSTAAALPCRSAACRSAACRCHNDTHACTHTDAHIRARARMRISRPRPSLSHLPRILGVDMRRCICVHAQARARAHAVLVRMCMCGCAHGARACLCICMCVHLHVCACAYGCMHGRASSRLRRSHLPSLPRHNGCACVCTRAWMYAHTLVCTQAGVRKCVRLWVQVCALRVVHHMHAHIHARACM